MSSDFNLRKEDESESDGMLATLIRKYDATPNIEVEEHDVSSQYEERLRRYESTELPFVKAAFGKGDEKDFPSFPEGMGKQIFYMTKKGLNRLSLLEVKGLQWNWELFVMDGNIIVGDEEKDIEKFETFEEGHKRAIELLEDVCKSQ